MTSAGCRPLARRESRPTGLGSTSRPRLERLHPGTPASAAGGGGSSGSSRPSNGGVGFGNHGTGVGNCGGRSGRHRRCSREPAAAAAGGCSISGRRQPPLASALYCRGRSLFSSAGSVVRRWVAAVLLIAFAVPVFIGHRRSCADARRAGGMRRKARRGSGLQWDWCRFAALLGALSGQLNREHRYQQPRDAWARLQQRPKRSRARSGRGGQETIHSRPGRTRHAQA